MITMAYRKKSYKLEKNSKCYWKFAEICIIFSITGMHIKNKEKKKEWCLTKQSVGTAEKEYEWVCVWVRAGGQGIPTNGPRTNQRAANSTDNGFYGRI